MTYDVYKFTVGAPVVPHVFVIVPKSAAGKERDEESESEEGGGRGSRPTLPSDCVERCKEVQPCPVGEQTHSKGPGEGNHPASVTHTPHTAITFSPLPPSDVA